MIEEVSSSKERELILYKARINEIVNEIKYHHNYETASALLAKYNLSFDELIRSTVKLRLNDLAILADRVINQK